ncbi:DNA ligase-1 [Anseongella ginsenosidimutans]|uniref:DNA ligase-1 n=1 Tax=Anseongella ginsenosidimutans TaxID=496056 RepID=A0A4V6NZ46_9SPHI|nr:hypothetical protein [Anseongella ginsenosidimutans]QEC51558.1 hypothetical protein FRZ59_03805 [Anseongella ginsenosidimutans]TCS88883.1 DNA ligase-1 [Anseongella ginsenosidimutans]
MNRFARLLEELELAQNAEEQVTLLIRYFRDLPADEKTAALRLLGGNAPKRCPESRQLSEWTLELSGIPEWLFAESAKVAGDAAETLALLLPFPAGHENKPLVYWLEGLELLPLMDAGLRKDWICDSWRELGPRERFVFNRLLCGSLKSPVSPGILLTALSQLTGIDRAILTWRFSREKAAGDGGGGKGTGLSYEMLALKESPADAHARPYPFPCCPVLEAEKYAPEPPRENRLAQENPPQQQESPLAQQNPSQQENPAAHWLEGRLGPAAGWTAQWQWAGIPAQIIHRQGRLHVWTGREELVTASFPELHAFIKQLPDGTVLEGELLGLQEGLLQPSPDLESRIGRKSLPKKLLEQLPAIFLATDCLEYEGKDLRQFTTGARRERLESLSETIKNDAFRLNPLIPFSSWGQLAGQHEKARSFRAEGLLLKKEEASALAAEGSRWNWKAAPYIMRGVLLYARRGAGTEVYTHFSIGAWERGKLISFATVESGLNEEEAGELSAFIRENSLEKFGPVRTVKPGVVFEIAFDRILPSARHRCGFRLCSPRLLRWLKNTAPDEAGMLETLKLLCE